MNFHKLCIWILICFCPISLFAQSDLNAPVKQRHFAIYAGIGPSIYFNNLVLGKDNVNSLNYSFSGRIMWEPEHLLSIGIESGYYRLYSLSFAEQPDLKISNSAIPIQIIVSMKILKTFYFNFSSGQTILINKVHTVNYGDLDASTVSLGDFAGTIGYKRQLKERMSLSAELKFFDSTKLDDKNMTLLFMFGYKF